MTEPQRAPRFRAAIFDMDGLLIDSERVTLRAWIDAAASLNCVLAQADYLQVVGRASRDSDALLTAMLGGRPMFEQVLHEVATRLADTGSEPLFPIKPGAAVLLQTLRDAGVPCAVASSSRRDEIEHRLARVGVLLPAGRRAAGGGPGAVLGFRRQRERGACSAGGGGGCGGRARPQAPCGRHRNALPQRAGVAGGSARTCGAVVYRHQTNAATPMKPGLEGRALWKT